MVELGLYNLEDVKDVQKYPYVGRSVATQDVVLFISPSVGMRILVPREESKQKLFVIDNKFAEANFRRLKGSITLKVE